MEIPSTKLTGYPPQHINYNHYHSLRRTTASIVKRMGGDPTSALDHASTRTTKRYLDPRIVGETPTSDFVDRFRKGSA